MIRSENRLVLVKDIWTKKYGLPGGTSEKGESAAQTAQRETQEETGILASPEKLLAATSNAFHIYDCRPRNDVIDTVRNGKLRVPLEGFNEIEEILLIDPSEIPLKKWRFPEQRQVLMDLLPKSASYRVVESNSSPDSLDRILPMISGELSWMKEFQSHQNTFWDAFFGWFSFLGGEGFALLLLPLIWFGLNQRKGLELTLLFTLATLVNVILKEVFSIPRPFYFLPELQREGATGFGFPSGHTLSVTLVWTWIALNFSFPGRWAVAWVISLLGGLARVYWGSHFFHDIVGGWCEALILISVYWLWLQKKKLGFIPLHGWLLLSWGIGTWALVYSPTPEAVAIASFLAGLWVVLYAVRPSAIFEGPLNQERDLRVRAFELAVALAGVFMISFGGSYLASSAPGAGVFLVALLIRVLKYLLLGVWVGLVGSMSAMRTSRRSV